MKTTLNLTISDENWNDTLENAQNISQSVFQKVIEVIKPEFLDGKKDVCINLELGNNEEIQRLNKEFRNLDKPTNILSFANLDDDEFWDILPNANEVELGDIIIALETIIDQSKEMEISFYDHYVHILVHGILHLLGYDHIEEEDRIEMESLEIKILKEFNIDNPYEENE